MEVSIDHILRKHYLSTDEINAIDVFLNALGVNNLVEMGENLLGIKQEEVTQLSDESVMFMLKDKLKVDNMIQRLNQVKIDSDVLKKNAHLPIGETLSMIIRLLLLEGIYPALGLDVTIRLNEFMQSEIIKTGAILGYSNQEQIKSLESIIEPLKALDAKERLYDWPYGMKNLIFLYEGLSDLCYVEADRSRFVGCFKNENPTFDEKIIWNTKKDETDLVFLAYRLWNGSHPKKSHFVAHRRFRKKEEDFNRNLLRRTFHNIASECIHDDDVILKRMDLLKIANKITQKHH